MNGSVYPPTAFYFQVVFGGIDDTSFQDVSGISSQMQTEQYVEGGENRFAHTLPKGVTHSNLVLKRGIAPVSSPLVKWCRSVLEGDLATPIQPIQMMVILMDENQDPIRSWSFAGAYPVKWDVDSFNSTKNAVAIETIELSYMYSNRES